METKICTKCLVEKKLSEYALQNKKTGVLLARCRACHAVYVKQHYRENKEYYAAKARANRLDHLEVTREYIKQAKSKPCRDCNNSYPSYVMDFDHIDADKIGNISSMAHLNIEVIKAEIDKCEVVCANCHRVRTFEGRLLSRVKTEVDRSYLRRK